ncbi:MAG: hypothetical protein ACI9DC_005422 [Gammaproteobacteria bacterium]
MNLHETTDSYLELIQATAEHQGIPAVYVEKDYWVTRVLKRLHASDHKHDIVFKGGTALSKAHRLIERFSEDIDLAARNRDMGDSRRKKLIKTVELIITQDLVYQEGHPLESKHGRFRKTAHAFPTQTEALQWGQVADTILVEINALGDPEPAALMPIATLVHDFLAATERTDLIDLFELAPFDILVLHVERTLCEKIMGLVRAGYEDDAAAEFQRRIRHFYDIVMILRQPKYREFIESDIFLPLLGEVKAVDRLSMPHADVWLDSPITDARIFAGTEALWQDIKSEFHGSFKDMLYGDDLPSDEEVLAALSTISASLSRG